MIAWLHSIRVRSQVFAALVVVPVVLALLGLSIVPQVLGVVLLDELQPATLDLAVRTVRYAVLGVVACGFVTALGAAALLRSSIRSTVDSIRVATEAISSGDFAHRIASHRTDELGDLARAVDTTAVRLQRLEQARRQMLACVSHELRTPLTIARNMAYGIGRSTDDPIVAGRAAQLDEELARLGSLIGDLVDAASLHAGGVRLARERVALVGVVEDAAARFRDHAAQRGVEVEVIVHTTDRRRPHASIDVDRVQQILSNLLANAVRHSDVGSIVTVCLRGGDRDAGVHAIEIVNRGERIPPELADRIFEPFSQHGERTGRVGLGLAIARDLAEAHGGDLALDVQRSMDAGGACFVLTLPAAAPSPPVDVLDAVASVRTRVGFAT
jgi:two-component system sensor histidine kinase BaeS